MKPNYISLPQVRELYGISKSFIYQLRREGKLKLYHINSKPFIKVSEFEALMKPEED